MTLATIHPITESRRRPAETDEERRLATSIVLLLRRGPVIARAIQHVIDQLLATEELARPGASDAAQRALLDRYDRDEQTLADDERTIIAKYRALTPFERRVFVELLDEKGGQQ